jgi:hypothetical protein
LLLEEAAYAALLDGLVDSRIAPSDEVLAVVVRLAEAVDRDNEYDRAVEEHDALYGLLGQLERKAA